MTQHANANFLAGAFANFFGYEFRDPAKPPIACGRLLAGLFAILGGSAFSDHHEGAFRSLTMAAVDFRSHFFVFERHLGKKDDIGPPSEPTLKGNPSGVASHDFQNDHSFVAGGGGVEAVERLGHAFHSGIESKCHGSRFEIVVDGFWDADNGEAGFVKQLGCIE